jgi:hypothetical protein
MGKVKQGWGKRRLGTAILMVTLHVMNTKFDLFLGVYYRYTSILFRNAPFFDLLCECVPWSTNNQIPQILPLDVACDFVGLGSATQVENSA